MFKLIAGPCVIESEDILFNVANAMCKIAKELRIDYYFKASFDKANRTSVHSYRGPGLAKGLEMLKRIKREFGFRIVTDIHEPQQAELAAVVADVIQIPAFLCRQTDLLLAAGRTGKLINVKKGQFMSAGDMLYVIQKIESAGNNNIWLCERGSSFGRHALVVDMTDIVEMKKFGYPVIMDATHSVQKPGVNGDTTGGNREYVEPLAKAAVAVGADGLFLETHPNPDAALSDGSNMLKTDNVYGLLEKILRIYGAVRND
jgi:2-dehydro-3-deoxyphosphooctonate aldolase (KDO 8-P synthase)